jgi:hypothetical protein
MPKRKKGYEISLATLIIERMLKEELVQSLLIFPRKIEVIEYPGGRKFTFSIHNLGLKGGDQILGLT